MACFSTVTKTKMTDAKRLEAAMQALGYQTGTSIFTGGKVMRVTGSAPGEYVMQFGRAQDEEAFSTTSTQLEKLQAIQRKYSELTVREFAKRKGFTVQAEGQKLTLINRRQG